MLSSKTKSFTNLCWFGCDFLSEHAKVGISITGWHISQHLIVGAVFLNYIDDMLENTRFADPLRHGAGGLVGSSGQLGFRKPLAPVILPHH